MILDAAEWGTAPEQIVLVVEQALARGWLSADEPRGGRVARLVAMALAEAGMAGVGA